jgi:uncharacterized protein YaiI (UPF0178 family)
MAAAVMFTLYHVVGVDMSPDVEATVHHEVVHFAQNAGVAVTMMRNSLREVVTKLRAHRATTSDSMDVRDDDIIAGLDKLLIILDKEELWQ